jgi:uncharacterized protein YecT (DUF1311 family)
LYDPFVRNVLIGIWLVLVVFGAGCGDAGKPRPHAAGEALRSPVLRESFKFLPCRPASPDDREGCAQHDLLEFDRQVNARVNVIFRLKLTKAERAAFVRSENAWHAYRRASCGGVGSTSIWDLKCKAMQDARHLFDLSEWPCSRAGFRSDDELCLSRAVARYDTEIKAQENAVARLIFPRSTTSGLSLRAKPDPTRAAFRRSERSWFGYREKVCTVEAAKYSVGSEQPNVFLGCELRRDVEHLALLWELNEYFSMG